MLYTYQYLHTSMFKNNFFTTRRFTIYVSFFKFHFVSNREKICFKCTPVLTIHFDFYSKVDFCPSKHDTIIMIFPFVITELSDKVSPVYIIMKKRIFCFSYNFTIIFFLDKGEINNLSNYQENKIYEKCYT